VRDADRDTSRLSALTAAADGRERRVSRPSG